MKKSDVIEYFGSAAAIARAVGISRQAVHEWPDELPVPRACQIEILTGGALRAENVARPPEPAQESAE